MTDPVCLLALYGHPDSITLWVKHRDESMEKTQLKLVQGRASCFMHVGLRVFLTIYVDDFKMAGPFENMDKAWKMTGSVIKLGKPTTAVKYLGCKHVPDQKYF